MTAFIYPVLLYLHYTFDAASFFQSHIGSPGFKYNLGGECSVKSRMKHKKISRHAVNKTPSRLETIDEEREVSFGDSAKSELYAKLPLLEICTYVGWSMFAWFCVISSLYQSSQSKWNRVP